MTVQNNLYISMPSGTLCADECTQLAESMHSPQKSFIYQITAISALGGLLFGFDTGVISGALGFMSAEYHLSTWLQEWVVSAVVLGAFAGAAFSGRLADQYGRRNILMAAAVLFIAGTLFLVLAKTVSWLITGRAVVGLAIGICSYATPLFISEMAPAAQRGFLVLFNAIMITGGEALAYFTDYLLTPSGNWRWMFALGLFPAILLGIGMYQLPATPRWLMLKGKREQAKNVLVKLRAVESVEPELKEIENSFTQPAKWQTLLQSPLNKVLLIGVGLGIFQQFVGINTIMYYGPTIFARAGFAFASTQLLATLLMGLINMVVSIVAVLIVDKMGRRRMLNIGSLLATVGLIVAGLSFAPLPISTSLRAWLALGALGTYIVGYCLGLGSMFWLVISEIYPLNVRSTAMSLAAGVQWLANFVVSLTFLSILQAIGPTDTFWVYAMMSALSFLFCYFGVPETSSVSLEHIERNLLAGKRTRELGAALPNTIKLGTATPTP